MIVVMGVSGAGKTTVGERLAGVLGAEWIEGDRLHPESNVAKMAAGSPLDDDDRAGWLETIRTQLLEKLTGGVERVVVACSALKRSYRERLLAGVPGAVIVYLKGSYPLIEERMRARAGHFMPVALLASQFEALEEPGADETAVVVDVDQGVDEIVRVLAARLG